MIEAAAAAGAGERDALVLETLMAFKRAGCVGRAHLSCAARGAAAGPLMARKKIQTASGRRPRRRPAPAGRVSERYARPLFILTIVTGSFLLFLTQPMIARMALPRVGGSPSVWNSAMLVYQLLLLAGYAYAHGLS